MTTHIGRQLKILDEVLHERDAQDAIFGVQDLPHGTGDEWMGAMAHVSRRECDEAFAAGSGTFRHVFLEEVYEAVAEDDPVKLRAELMQAIAVGVKWVEAIDRAGEEAP
ncbi:hypothetical protein M2271_003563 [Streptomyces sp. LBL]|uniref:hypothetical protein n=1 Tax=Streptomyces sp. LBL TaxID=2940562 RepID=UPI0024731DD9|nr:hypothetical protein [Streptomyces sp. LBL]MDH6625752.1 hypothetical protein [Streptomyces sp. LBL]